MLRYFCALVSTKTKGESRITQLFGENFPWRRRVNQILDLKVYCEIVLFASHRIKASAVWLQKTLRANDNAIAIEKHVVAHELLRYEQKVKFVLENH